ncbi:MAG: gamma-glutamyl-gamma-aminobutyrate hydrolase family protein [Tissierellaceae bacterium]|nr:gamma-glutamyl-gamma-aminobutyrate hydrolase family protein [Tissierellaceae bacterium]
MKRILIINNEKDYDDFGWIPVIMEAISKIEKIEFVVIHHSEISKEKLDEINPDLIYSTGRVTYDWDIEEILEDYAAELEMMKTTTIPVLGVCAGLQLMAIAYGAGFGKMVETADDEEAIRETGFQEIEIIKDAPLLENLSNPFRCYELHRDEIKDVPEGFELLASTEMCKRQAIKHKEKSLYGVQFHPEQYTNEYLDGQVILKNFLKMANIR